MLYETPAVSPSGTMHPIHTCLSARHHRSDCGHPPPRIEAGLKSKAIGTDQHLLLLPIALGAADEQYQTTVLEGGITDGILAIAMDGYFFTSDGPIHTDSKYTAEGDL